MPWRENRLITITHSQKKAHTPEANYLPRRKRPGAGPRHGSASSPGLTTQAHNALFETLHETCFILTSVAPFAALVPTGQHGG